MKCFIHILILFALTVNLSLGQQHMLPFDGKSSFVSRTEELTAIRHIWSTDIESIIMHDNLFRSINYDSRILKVYEHVYMKNVDSLNFDAAFYDKFVVENHYSYCVYNQQTHHIEIIGSYNPNSINTYSILTGSGSYSELGHDNQNNSLTTAIREIKYRNWDESKVVIFNIGMFFKEVFVYYSGNIYYSKDSIFAEAKPFFQSLKNSNDKYKLQKYMDYVKSMAKIDIKYREELKRAEEANEKLQILLESYEEEIRTGKRDRNGVLIRKK